MVLDHKETGLADLPGFICREAVRNGRVVYESAA